jgi:hypothetical protein
VVNDSPVRERGTCAYTDAGAVPFVEKVSCPQIFQVKGRKSMAQMTSRTRYPEERVGGITHARSLGLIALAFTTALIGCSFAHVLLPGPGKGTGLVTAAALIFGGIVQFLAGMWEFRRAHAVTGTIFAAYGGFLATFGVFFLPPSGLLNYFGIDLLALNHALGLLFLCWTLCLGVLLAGSLRTNNMMLMAVLALLGLAYFFLMIGEFANANTPLLMIGGWIAIICALVAWYCALAGMLAPAEGTFKAPMEYMAEG